MTKNGLHFLINHVRRHRVNQRCFCLILLLTFDDKNILSDMFKIRICDFGASKMHHITKFVSKDKHRLQRHIWGGGHCAKSGDGFANIP
jgi:hypothetical protein